jgi:DNA-binding transcriptional ArsR family regulator
MVRQRDTEAGVWRAMSDPSRRKILDLLRVRPRTTGQLAREFSISRIAVMRHLAVLGQAGLVVSRKRGRERWHYLNALPLERLHRRWVGPVEAGWARRLLLLDSRLASRGRRGMEGAASTLAIDIAQELALTRSRSDVFRALGSVASWWGPPYVSASATDLRLDLRLGGAFEEVWGSAGGRLLAIVTAFEADRRLELTGPFHLGIVYGVVQFQLDDAGPGTRLSFSHRGIGSVSDEAAATFAEGWKELLTVRLVALVERGVKLGIGARSGKRRNGDGK